MEMCSVVEEQDCQHVVWSVCAFFHIEKPKIFDILWLSDLVHTKHFHILRTLPILSTQKTSTKPSNPNPNHPQSYQQNTQTKISFLFPTFSPKLLSLSFPPQLPSLWLLQQCVLHRGIGLDLTDANPELLRQHLPRGNGFGGKQREKHR